MSRTTPLPLPTEPPSIRGDRQHHRYGISPQAHAAQREKELGLTQELLNALFVYSPQQRDCSELTELTEAQIRGHATPVQPRERSARLSPLARLRCWGRLFPLVPKFTSALVSTGRYRTGVYTKIRIGKALISTHRAVWIYHHGAIPAEMVVDHINQDKHDNRIENLRLATTRENGRNVGDEARQRQREGAARGHQLRRDDLVRRKIKKGSSHETLLKMMENAPAGDYSVSRIGEEMGLNPEGVKKLKAALRDNDHPLTVSLLELGVKVRHQGKGRGARTHLLKEAA